MDYDDGEKERGVREELIKAVGGSGDRGDRAAASATAARRRGGGGGGAGLREGDKVEARPRPQPVLPRAHRGDNRDGTFDVDYDDGEKERGVREG